MSESDDDYDYTREVPMPSDDDDEDLMQVVLAKLLEYMSSNRLSFDAIFRQFDRELAGWSQKNLMDALRAAGMDLSDATTAEYSDFQHFTLSPMRQARE